MKAQSTDRTERIGIGATTMAFEAIGFAFRPQEVSDYGIDAHAELIEDEKATGRLIAIQVKTGPSYLAKTEEDSFIFSVDDRHVKYWKSHSLPVVICLCDPKDGTVYWQRVGDDTVKSTGKHFKILVPQSQIVDSNSRSLLAELVTPVVPDELYTVASEADSSHATAKRCVLRIILNKNLTKPEIAAVIRQATQQARSSRYLRSERLKQKWGDQDSHVVWTFIYGSAEEESQNNHISKSLWIDDALDQSAKPAPITGENIGKGITTEWSQNRDVISALYSLNKQSKSTYLEKVVPLITELPGITNAFTRQVKDLSNGVIDEDEFLQQSGLSRQRIDEIYEQLNNAGIAPYECKDVDAKLESLVASLHNIHVIYGGGGWQSSGPSARLEAAKLQIAAATKEVPELEYEYKKIR